MTWNTVRHLGLRAAVILYQRRQKTEQQYKKGTGWMIILSLKFFVELLGNITVSIIILFPGLCKQRKTLYT